MAKVVSIRRGMVISEAQQRRAEATQRIGALLRRAYMFDPWEKFSIRVYFNTAAEADEFQRLAHALRKGR